MSLAYPPHSLLPPEKTVDVWLVDLDMKLDREVRFDRLLSVEERDRASRFIFAKDTARYVLCRAVLRLGLGWYLGVLPEEVALTTGYRGKPRLSKDSSLHFNVTHSEDLALIAFTTIGEVGIDAEALCRDVEALEIASAHFTQEEAQRIAAAGSPYEQAGRFLRYWTRKEAVLKAAGCGIGDGLDAFDVSKENANLVRLKDSLHESPERLWMVRDLDGIEGFAAAIAAPALEWSVRQWFLRDQEALLALVKKDSR